MSTFRNPVGPQSSRVYWRRRLLVLIGLLAVIFAIVLVIVQPGTGSANDTNTSSADAADDVADGTAEESTAEVEPVPEPDAIEGADCDPANVKVEALTDKGSYAPGELPQLSFSITNTSGTACMFNVGTTQQTFLVSSGADLYWSSKDCETDPVDSPLLLEPNLAVTSAPIPWDRTRSAPETCAGERPAAPGGGATFNLTVSVGPVESVAPKSFLLY